MKVLNKIQGLIFFIVIIVLIVIIQFKNGSIKRLRIEVAEKPQIEYVYNNTVDTIIQEKIIPKDVIVYKDKPIYIHDSIPLTNADSAQIAEAYSELYVEYNSTKKYDDVLKDDTLAYIKLYEEVSQNAISNRKLEYQDRTPIVNITNTITKQDKTLSITGGLGANIGKDINSVSLRLGVVSPANRVYTVGYDPINKAWGGSIDFPIFNFRR